ncbi:terminase [Bradyrhizobium valentinum]|uniref:Terminase n=1 Tax=Bradyrhizobium valentinum TaxID=1518501 RepID=A0A0R3KUF7_9BRAD|nr:terminase [Bradyrhizobium valentinum]
MTASQSGKTEAMLDIAGQRLDQKPAPILYVGPNKQFLTEQFEPRVMSLLDEAPTLAIKVARGKRMTKTRKVIAGVPLRLAHAGSSAALKSDPAALALVDEYDEMLANIKGQGDPLGLVERRGDTYADFVCAVTSTCRRGMIKIVQDEESGLRFWDVAPTDDLESPIWRLWQQGTRFHWAWPCPHCREYFIPRFECTRWPEKATPFEAERASYIECPRCGGVIEEEHKALMNERGVYVAPGQSISSDGVVTGEAPQALSLSFWVSGLASPFVTIGERVRAYLEALTMADDGMVQTAINAGFGELYAPGSIGANDWHAFKRRRMPHKFGEVPLEVMRLTAAVDVSGNGFWYSIRGWGERASSWQIESGEIAGFTNEPEVWNDLANVLLDTYGGLPISLALIDSGFRANKPNEGPTNVVYDFCRRFRRFCKPTKGYDTLTAPMMRGKAKMTIPGQRAPVELELVRLDTDFWKSRLHERLAWPHEQPGGFLLAADASDDYLKQLASEVRKITPSGRPQWVPLTRRNHFLDVEAMNEAAGHMLAVQKIPLGAKRQETIDDDDPSPPPVVDPPPGAPPPNGVRRRMSGIAARLNR